MTAHRPQRLTAAQARRLQRLVATLHARPDVRAVAPLAERLDEAVRWSA